MLHVQNGQFPFRIDAEVGSRSTAPAEVASFGMAPAGTAHPETVAVIRTVPGIFLLLIGEFIGPHHIDCRAFEELFSGAERLKQFVVILKR